MIAKLHADGTVQVPSAMFFDNLSNDFQSLSDTLSKSALAGYLLGFDTAGEQCLATIGNANFAEGDDEKAAKKASLVKSRQRPLVRRGDTRGKGIHYLPYGKDQTAAEIGRVGGPTLASLRFDVPPQEAIDFFKRKKVLSADKFYELEAEARSGAFAIANVYKTDVTSALQQELIDALQNGRTQQEVIKRMQGILDGSIGQKMLGPAHLETVFRTATQMAYGVGRRIAQEESKDYLPIWEYTAVGDDRTRPTHMALDGLQYPVDHPFWDTYYPPWEWRCRCSVIPVLDYRKNYEAGRPNKETAVDFDDDGIPVRANVSGRPVRIEAGPFNVPRQANLGQVLNSAAERALDARKQ